MIKKIVIFLLLISSVYFFRLIFLPTQIIYLTMLGITGMMFVIVIVQEIYGRSETIKHNFRHPIFLIFTGVFLSMIFAQAYHNQSYVITFWAQRFMYYYLFYFFLHILKPDIKDLERIVLTMGILYAIFTLVQYTIYPIRIIDVFISVERGTIRFWAPGSTFMTLSLYYYLNRFYNLNKIRNIFPVIIFLSIMVLQGSRTGLSINILVILFSLIFSKTIRSRYLIFFIVLISIIPIYFIFQDIFGELLEVTERQSRNFESDIRIRAATFFLTDYFPNTLGYFFGNGQPHGTSIYGMRVHAYAIYQGFYQADIGFIGDFSKFGLFFALGAVWLLLKLLKAPLKSEYNYIKYYLFVRIIGLPVTTPFSSEASIVLLCIMMYVVDKEISGLKQKRLDQENKAPDETHGHGHGIIA